MSDTPRVPSYWWHPDHGVICLTSSGHWSVSNSEEIDLPADAVKLGDVEALREQLDEAREALRGYTVSEEEYEQACGALSERTKELANLRAEIRAVLDDPARAEAHHTCGWLTAIRAIVDREPASPQPDSEDACPHCSPTHARPESRPWGVYVSPQRDGDGQPTHLVVMPTNGAHVAQSDADWLWQLIRDYRPGPRPVPEPEPEPQRSTGRWGRGA